MVGVDTVELQKSIVHKFKRLKTDNILLEMKSQNFCDASKIKESPESHEVSQHIFICKGKSGFVSYLVEKRVITKY